VNKKKRSETLGETILEVKVSNINRHGFWLLIDANEHFVDFDNFPWFREASVVEICNVERPGADHLYWPLLDIDLAVESIEHPSKFPLVSKVPLRRRETVGT